MAKIIVEHVTKRPNVRLSVFVDGVKVGDVSNRSLLAVDVGDGDHLLHVGLGKKKMEGVGIPFRAVEHETKKIRTRLTMSALFAAKWHYFLLMAGLMAFVMVAARLLSGGMVRQEHVTFALVLLPISIPTYFLVQAKRKKNPKNFIEIEVVD